MAVINPQPILGTGLQPVYSAVSASDTLTNNGNSFLHVKNGNAAICTVTIDSVTPCDQGSDHDLVVAVPATTGDRMIGPLPMKRFGASPTVTYSVQATVTAALVALPT
jgi:hypothetical protein